MKDTFKKENLMQIAWKSLISLGIVLIVLAFNLDTTVSTGYGERVHNLGLQAQQQMMVILGGVLFLAGVVLFGVAKLKQPPEDQQREQQQRQAALEEAGAVVQGGLEKSGLAIANLIVGLKLGTDMWGARLVLGLFTACAWSLAGGVASQSGGLATLLFAGAFVVSFWPTPAATVLSRLSIAHLGVTLLFFAVALAMHGQGIAPEHRITVYAVMALVVVLPSVMAALAAMYARRHSPPAKSEHAAKAV